MMNEKQQKTECRAASNILGPRIRKFRVKGGWSQAQLAIRLQLRGLDFGRDVVAQIECQIHGIRDRDIPIIARALEVEVGDLFSNLELKASLTGISPAKCCFQKVAMISSQPDFRELVKHSQTP